MCPITSLKIVSVENSTKKFELSVSKNDDSLPMMATFVGYKKCLDQDSEATDPKSVFYPLEIQQAQTCTKFDTRFNDVGFEISEY